MKHSIGLIESLDGCGRAGAHSSGRLRSAPPLPGDGSAEWTGDFRPIATSINPAQGWLANWNNKPSIDWDNPDHQTLENRIACGRSNPRLAGVTVVPVPGGRRDVRSAESVISSRIVHEKQ